VLAFFIGSCSCRESEKELHGVCALAVHIPLCFAKFRRADRSVDVTRRQCGALVVASTSLCESAESLPVLFGWKGAIWIATRSKRKYLNATYWLGNTAWQPRWGVKIKVCLFEVQPIYIYSDDFFSFCAKVIFKLYTVIPCWPVYSKIRITEQINGIKLKTLVK
jgi:hypothetical protein